jgi:hypothetical protein
MTTQEFHQGFRHHFPDLGFPGRFIDTVMLQATKEPHLDVMALDDELNVPDGISTADFITQKYGPDAAAWARKAI